MRQRLVSAAEAIWPVNGKLVDQMVVGASIRAELEDGELLISGVVPSSAMKESIGKAGERAEIAKVTNELRIDESVPAPRWGFAMGYYLGEVFHGAESGELAFAPGRHRIIGTLSPEANLTSLKEKGMLLMLGSGTLDVKLERAGAGENQPVQEN